MRIKGLLRAFRSIRSRLQAGLGPEEASKLRAEVGSILQTVERICAQGGITPEQLPAPSRRVYKFLQDLNARPLPVASPGGSEARARVRLALRNALRLADHFADQLWLQRAAVSSSSDARQQILADIRRHVAVIEGICARQQVTPGALELPSRQVYCWLKFLLNEDNFAAHLAALAQVSAALDECRPAASSPVRVHLVNLGAVCRRRQYANVLLLKVNEGFLAADPTLWRALMKVLFQGPDPQASHLLKTFAASEEFTEVVCELESYAETGDHSLPGCVHNLRDSFARVNAAYFGGSLAEPRLVWNGALTGRKFGHYRSSTDTLMLSLTLDASEVPSWVVDFVMYHELLHKKHGVSVVQGRRLAHTPAFRAEERRFARYAEAERLLDGLARRG